MANKTDDGTIDSGAEPNTSTEHTPVETGMDKAQETRDDVAEDSMNTGSTNASVDAVESSNTGSERNKPRKSRKLLVMAVIVWILILCGLGYWGYTSWVSYSSQTSHAEDRVLALEAVVQHLHEDLERFTASTERVLQQANSNNQTLAERDQALGDEIQSLAARLRESETQRSGDWELAEASYLARLAEQRLIISGDTDSARELLFEADQILRDLGYPELRNARQALANARQALSMAHVPDTQRIFFELNALKTLSTGLVINQLDQLEPLQSDASHAGGDGFWSNLGVAIKNHLGPFFIVRKQDSAPNLQASVDEEFVLRNRLALQLEQAQMAVLNPDQTIYDAALKSAHELVLAHFVEGSQRDGFLSQIDSLAAEQLQAQIPDLSAMQRALLDAEHVLQSRVDGP